MYCTEHIYIYISWGGIVAHDEVQCGAVGILAVVLHVLSGENKLSAHSMLDVCIGSTCMYMYW